MAATTRARIASRLTAPILTGLRSRKGLVMLDLASRRSRMPNPGRCAELLARCARSSREVTPPVVGRVGVVRDRQRAGRQDDLRPELAQVEVEERSVDRRPPD